MHGERKIKRQPRSCTFKIPAAMKLTDASILHSILRTDSVVVVEGSSEASVHFRLG